MNADKPHFAWVPGRLGRLEPQIIWDMKLQSYKEERECRNQKAAKLVELGPEDLELTLAQLAEKYPRP